MKINNWEKINIDEVSETSWSDWKPKTKIGEKFLYWAGCNLPRHMPIEDWNLPWAVCFTMAIEQIISQQISFAEKEIIKKIINLVAKEMLIANQEKQPTSRLTSLAMKILESFKND